MTWLIYAAMFSQVVVLYWLAAPTTLRLMYRSYLAKNPGWISAHPEFIIRHVRQKYAIGLAYTLGLGWIVYLVRGVLTESDNDWLVAALFLPMLGWVALELVLAGVEYQRVCKKIPLPDKRRASFERRNLRDFAHPAWIYPGLLMLIAICGAYLTAYVRGLIESELLTWRLCIVLIGSAMWGASLRYCIRRKKQPIDDALGPMYRRSEVLGTIVCLYLFALALGFLVLQDLFDIVLLSDVTFAVSASVVLQIVVLFWIKKMLYDDRS